ncbi:MAG: hypothetical protein JST81_09110 [Bacteroidetes bacterium]|jgi:hypothetical protein|nr:hypothetical protein [Bacteroidota bacterium]
MKTRKATYCYFLFLLLLAGKLSFSQSLEVNTNKSQVLIGERVEYNLSIKLPALEGYDIDSDLPDTIPHFEILDNNGIDTIKNQNGTFSLQQKIVFTSFDSGAWYIPSFAVNISQGKRSVKLFTDSVLVNVGYSPADTTADIRDIKPVIEVKVKSYFWYYVCAIILTVVIIFYLLNVYFAKRKAKPLPVLYSALSPYDEAMKALRELNESPLQIETGIKEYHSQIGFIFKRYFSRITDVNLLNKTTGGLLLELKQKNVDAAVISALAASLRTGDVVKFAKHIPADSESEQCAATIKDAIEKINKEKPVRS